MIEDGAFEKLPNLQNLRLNSNKIRAISNDTFRMVSGLEKLELQDNAIQTIGKLALRDLQNLRMLSMSKNELETLPTGLFNGLDLIEEIYLSSNKLAEIQKGTFKNLSKVKYIVLNKNLVNRVESHAFESLPALERVYLDANNIKEMQKNCFGNGTKLDRLYLGSNPLICDCGMKWLMDYVKTHHTSLELESREGSRVDVLCDKPDTLKGRRVLDLPENSFYCECRIPGIMYSGTENKTMKGLGCQYWSDQKPHRHDYDMLGMNQSNYCRNFDRDRAWCLTNQTDVLWDYCYVPVCVKLIIWSVMRLVNNGIAAITDTNKSVCYTSDKRRFLSAIQTKLEGMRDGDHQKHRKEDRDVYTYKFTLCKIISKDKKELPNRRSYLNNRQSHVYHEIVDFDQSLKMPYEIEEKKEREGHSYVTLQQKESGPNETPTMVDASHNRLSVLYINTAHSEQYDKSSKSKDTSLKETSMFFKITY
ncbi:leucine-rich repeat and fibronectin type-III domain-containing protein 5-like [Saccostrea cucullata]|uniref:leucine-rich repeat and fibronectin type-III domain-containing protein 5-like n=1 Tax=Saccostrea cuccullata TaxID=36930 RepID=UPI002ED4622A